MLVATSPSTLERSDALVPFRLEERNALACKIIASYARKHAAIDVAVGIAGMVPFMAIPALAGSIALQAPVIYKPMAMELATVYMARPDHLQMVGRTVVEPGIMQNAMLDIASEFGQEFLLHIAKELIVEVGMGAVAALAVPFVGGAIGAALDYLIATQMTWRVGAMTSVFFQNGGWINSKQHTFEIAKELSGGIRVGVSDMLNGKFRNHTPRIDLDDIRKKVPSVRGNLVRNLSGFVGMMRSTMREDQIREILASQGVPADLIAVALGAW